MHQRRMVQVHLLARTRKRRRHHTWTKRRRDANDIDNTSPYAKLATTMRAPQPYGSTYKRGATVYPRTTKITEELGRLLNRLELRKRHEFDFDFSTHHC